MPFKCTTAERLSYFCFPVATTLYSFVFMCFPFNWTLLRGVLVTFQSSWTRNKPSVYNQYDTRQSDMALWGELIDNNGINIYCGSHRKETVTALKHSIVIPPLLFPRFLGLLHIVNCIYVEIIIKFLRWHSFDNNYGSISNWTEAESRELTIIRPAFNLLLLHLLRSACWPTTCPCTIRTFTQRLLQNSRFRRRRLLWLCHTGIMAIYSKSHGWKTNNLQSNMCWTPNKRFSTREYRNQPPK